MYLKQDGTKHKARDLYLVTRVLIENQEAEIQKFMGAQLRQKRYLVKLSQLFKCPSYSSSSVNKESSISIPSTSPVENLPDCTLTDPDSSGENEDFASLGRSTRVRNKPEWLSTSEIQRISDED